MVSASQEVRVIDFADRHELKAVASHDEGGAALIDDKYVRVGQVIDGFRLVEVSERQVTLVAGEVQVRLKLSTGPRGR